MLKKVLFISSSGGHLSELLQLESLFPCYESYLATEKDSSTEKMIHKNIKHIFYFYQARRGNLFAFIIKNLANFFISLYVFAKIRPEVVVSTGANTAVFMCYIAKFFRKKVLYIETFALSKRKTLSGKFIYPIADVFYVQSEEMIKLYPKAIYKGALY